MNVYIKEEADFSANLNEPETDTSMDIKPFQDGPTTMITCPKCYDIFNDESKFADHILTHSPWYIMYVCGVCSLTLEEKDLLVKHILSHITPVEEPSSNDHWENDSDSDYNVSLIDLKKKTENILSHIRPAPPSYDVKIETEPIENEISVEVLIENPKASSNIKGNSRNKGLHSQRKPSTRKTKSAIPYRCDKCGKSYSWLNSLLRHKLAHAGVKPFVCEKCGKGFADKRSIQCHNFREHKEDPDGYDMSQSHPCETCGRIFFTLQALKQHSIVHSGARPFECRTCRRTFPRKHQLIEHERTHTGEMPFVCEICERPFSRNSRLARHIKLVHTDDRPYVCETCGKAYALRWKLRAHVRTCSEGDGKSNESGQSSIELDGVIPSQVESHEGGGE